MPAKKQDRVLLTCPHCGHQQLEPPTAFSTICKRCGQHLRVQEILNPAPTAPVTAPRQRPVTCFECGEKLMVSTSAESTMCKRCSSYVDLHDYHISSAVAKNFKTKGTFVVEPKGYVFNSETVVGDAVIRGKFHGKLVTEGSLTIYSTADIKGSLAAGHLIIPAENHFRWLETIEVGSAEIGGELAAGLLARNTVILRATARVFGDVEARHLAVEEGAVVVGRMQIGTTKTGRRSRSTDAQASLRL